MGTILKGLLVLLVAGVAGGAAAWKLSPTFRELLWLAGLASGVDPVQRESAQALADYPSDRSALALIAFVNLNYRAPFDTKRWREAFQDPQAAPDALVEELATMLEGWGCLGEGAGASGLRRLAQHERSAARECADEVLRGLETDRKRDAKLAERGVRSLCILTGHDFGSHYESHGSSHSWGSLSDRDWEHVLGQLNGWAFHTFGPGALATGGGFELGSTGEPT